MCQAEGVFSRHERTKRSSRSCDLSDTLISGLAIEAADTKEGHDQWGLCARCLVWHPSCVFEKCDHLLTLRSETAFSIIRLVELTSLEVSDVTWNYVPPIIWSTIEICVGIFCACLPVMAPLVPVFLRGRSGPKESGNSSSFGRSNPRKITNDYVKQSIRRLDDDTIDLVPESDYSMSIKQTTNIDVHEEDSIELHTMA